MRQNTAAVQVQPPTYQERKKAFKLLMMQALSAIVVAGVFLVVKSLNAGLLALAGGLACVIPNLLFTVVLFFANNPRAVKRLALIFYVGEIVKLLMSALAVAGLILACPRQMLAVIVGFIGAQLGNWLAPLLKDKCR